MVCKNIYKALKILRKNLEIDCHIRNPYETFGVRENISRSYQKLNLALEKCKTYLRKFV
jgi:hypothetical protein